MRSRSLVVAALVATALVALAAPVAAHVSVRPGEAVRGTVAALTFSVPNERDDAATVAVAVELPGSFETVEPLANGEWTPSVDDGVVRWSGGRLTGTDRVELVVRVGPLSGPDQLVLPAVQTYEDGEVVRWIEKGLESGHPAPVLALTGEEVTSTTTTEATPSTTAATASGAEPEEAVAGARAGDGGDDDGGIPVVILVLAGVVALLAAGYAVARRSRP